MKRIQEWGDDYCFACGGKNPKGLHLTFETREDRLVTQITLDREYQGYTGAAHGGIVSTMLDEVMANYMTMRGEKAVTARIDVRFRQTTPLGEPLTVSGWLEGRRGKFVTMKSEVRLADGTVTAEGTATMAVVEEAAKEE